jgi:hypothetical protein
LANMPLFLAINPPNLPQSPSPSTGPSSPQAW